MRWTSFAAPLLLLVCKAVSADDAANVANAVNDLYRSLGARDLGTLAMYIPQEGFTEFNPEHKDLQIVGLNMFKGAFDAGVAINLHVEQLRARVMGNTAIVTGYRVGAITFPDGKVVSERQCLTMNWSKAKTWTLQHVHLSMCSA
jgi:ketosteroid isomerase-like protein